MKLSEVIHFYLGQKVRVSKKCTPEDTYIGEIVEVSNGHSNHGRWIEVNFFNVVYVVSCGTWEKTGSNMHHFFIGEDNIQLILRRVEDMKDGEMLEMFHKDGYYVFRDSIDAIQTSKNIIRGSEYRPDTFAWLLSRGFDLFNLIDSGQAIDAKTIK